MRTLIIGGAAINQEVEDLMKAIKLPYTVEVRNDRMCTDSCL